jgi:hypothetical protein
MTQGYGRVTVTVHFLCCTSEGCDADEVKCSTVTVTTAPRRRSYLL